MSKVKPYFGGSFIQSWYCQDWDINRWHQELQGGPLPMIISEEGIRREPKNRGDGYENRS